MGRIAYVNGRYVPQGEAVVHIEDRGYQFADAVYEVCAVHGGRMLNREGHLARLSRSLSELSIAPPLSEGGLVLVMREMVRRNRIKDGILYIQISRGVAPRDHFFPAGVRASCVMTGKAVDFGVMERKAQKGLSIRTLPDLRWRRCDIKTVGLLANVLAKQAAVEAGAGDAWLVDEDGFVTEGASANAWIVDADGALVTHPLAAQILGGISRATILNVAAGLHISVAERRFSVEEAKSAREAFCSSAGQFVMPVTRIDGQPIGNGEPGIISRRLREAYIQAAMAHVA